MTTGRDAVIFSPEIYDCDDLLDVIRTRPSFQGLTVYFGPMGTFRWIAPVSSRYTYHHGRFQPLINWLVGNTELLGRLRNDGYTCELSYIEDISFPDPPLEY